MKVCNHRAEKLGRNRLKSVYNLKLGGVEEKSMYLGVPCGFYYIVFTSSVRRA